MQAAFPPVCFSQGLFQTHSPFLKLPVNSER